MPYSYPSRISVMGVPIDPYTMEETVAKACDYVNAGGFAHFIGVNADKYLQMQDSEEMDRIVRGCELINADGASMLLAAEQLGVKLPERVAGVDLMLELCVAAQQRNLRVFLLGAKEEVVKETKSVLEEKYPGLNIVGYRNGYFSDDEFDLVANVVSEKSPDIVFVGITSPKKERLIERFRVLGLRGDYVGVGGTFDVISGKIPRAPKWMQKARLEWLFRLMQEPKRLFKRYAIGNMRFLVLVRKEKQKLKASQR